ncbi:hypothetical protein BC938DRAFT_483695 [Jimgerdemannia flammicorona]|uniref:Uncharacterized protein n=1 Tax=Jimgerdemannia flammicorona TaxID=994334 RepID=A0A433QBE1_9FUNG|nr:hypothetical protein BC938DRAFT_483695 [Jimgerdemannia flammicorona]
MFDGYLRHTIDRQHHARTRFIDPESSMSYHRRQLSAIRHTGLHSLPNSTKKIIESSRSPKQDYTACPKYGDDTGVDNGVDDEVIDEYDDVLRMMENYEAEFAASSGEWVTTSGERIREILVRMTMDTVEMVRKTSRADAAVMSVIR